MTLEHDSKFKSLPCPARNTWVDNSLSIFDGEPVEKLSAQCEDGTFWMCEYRAKPFSERGYSQWERYILPDENEVPPDYPPPYIPE